MLEEVTTYVTIVSNYPLAQGSADCIFQQVLTYFNYKVRNKLIIYTATYIL